MHYTGASARKGWQRNKLDLHGRKLKFWKICAEEKLKMCNRVKYHISHKDVFSAVIACRTASGQFSTAQPEKGQPAGSRGAERWFQRTCKMSSARAAHGKPPSFLYKNNTKKKLTEMTTYFNLYKFTTPFLYISWFIIFLHVALWTYHLLSHHLGWFFF